MFRGDNIIQEFSVAETDFKGVLEIRPFYSEDSRGWFLKDYSTDLFEKFGLKYPLNEVFYSYSKSGVLRGLHFQYGLMQPKLIRCIQGCIFDVIVDLRMFSKTFKKYKIYELSSETPMSIFVPAGFAHGFYALEDSIVSYKCATCFNPAGDSGIIWNDSDLNIPWPSKYPLISEKDSKLQSLNEFMLKYSDYEDSLQISNELCPVSNI